MGDFDWCTHKAASDSEQRPVDGSSPPRIDGASVDGPTAWSPEAWWPETPATQPPSSQSQASAAEMVSRQSPTLPPPSLIDFDEKMIEVDGLLNQFPQQEGRGPLNSVYEDMKAGRGDPSAPEPTGAMMAGVDQYAADTEKLDKRWDHLDPKAAAKSLRKSMNRDLALDHVPPLEHNLPDVPDGAGPHLIPRRGRKG